MSRFTLLLPSRKISCLPLRRTLVPRYAGSELWNCTGILAKQSMVLQGVRKNVEQETTVTIPHILWVDPLRYSLFCTINYSRFSDFKHAVFPISQFQWVWNLTGLDDGLGSLRFQVNCQLVMEADLLPQGPNWIGVASQQGC